MSGSIKPDNTVEQRPIDAQTVNEDLAIVIEGSRCRRARRGQRTIPARRRTHVEIRSNTKRAAESGPSAGG